jgi:riboflavin-specific deaminase-like protein
LEESILSGHDFGYPSVSVHYAQTLDGRIATSTGQSQWISGEKSLGLAHQLRAEHQAVMVGVGTVLADNPRLTVRLAPGESPCRVVLDSTLRLPLDASVLIDGQAHTIIATTARANQERLHYLRQLGVETLIIGQDAEGRVDLKELLRHLRAKGMLAVLIEGGHGVITSALRAGVVERLVVCIAPKVIGVGLDAVGDLSIRRLSEGLTFTEKSVRQLGEDIVFDGRFGNGSSNGENGH